MNVKMKTLMQVFSSAAAAGAISLAAADTLELRDGRTVDGVLIGATGDTLYLRAGGQVQRLNVDEVASIRFDRRPLAQPERGPGDSALNRTVIIAAGAPIMVALPKDLARDTLAEGDHFTASLSQDFRSGEVIISPAGSKVYGRVVSPPPGGLAIVLTDLSVKGDRLPINTRSRPLPPAGDADANLEFRVERPFTLRLASN